MKPIVSMRNALADESLFAKVLPGPSWESWRVLLIAMMGEELIESERAVFTELTGRPHEPSERVDEAWFVIGRRGGKTRAIAILAAYVAALCDWDGVGAPGERLEVIAMSKSVDQAQKIRQYLSGIFNTVPALRKMISNETGEMLSLKNGIDIWPRPASYRTVRGSTAICAIGDEIAFWYDELSRNPAEEVIAAVRPSLATTRGLLAIISSPYARRGLLYETYSRYFRPDGDPRVLVAKAPSKRMNPLLDDAFVARAYDRDPVRARCEYEAEWRGDLEGFISLDMLEPCISPVPEIPYSPMHSYMAFVDPSGGRNDSFTMAIGHAAGEIIVVDHLSEIQPPFRPSEAVARLVEVLQRYNISVVIGDNYAGSWVPDEFWGHRIQYEASPKNRSQLYLEMLPRIMSRSVWLPKNMRVINQLTGLQRRVANSGRESIDHPPNGHDDCANAVAGVVEALAEQARRPMLCFG